MLTATARAEHMAQQIFGWARLHTGKTVTARLVDELMSRDRDTEQGKANRATVCRILRAQAEAEGIRVILTEKDRYWAIREQLHHMAPADVAALRDSISDGGDRDPRGSDQSLIDAITARESNRPVPARLWDCKPVTVRLWAEVDPYTALYRSLSDADMSSATYDVTSSKDGVERACPAQEGKRLALAVAIKHGDGARTKGNADEFTVDWRGVKNGPGEVVFTFRRRTAPVAEEPRPQSVSDAVKASGLSLGDLVQFPGRVVETDAGREFAPGRYGYLRDAWLSDGQVVAAVEGEDGQRDVPLLSDLRPLHWHMRTVNGGTPERIPTLDALREINNAMLGEGRKGVREMSASGGDARIVYRDVRGEVWLRPATSAEIAMEQKPEGERYAPGDRVIVRGTFYRPEKRRTYVLDEYEGTVTNWAAGHYNVRAVEPDADGVTYGVRPCRVRELRPVPPAVEDVVEAPHDLYLSGELRHQGVSAERVRRIVKNLRGKRAVFFQDPADGAIVTQTTRYVPQRPAGAPELAGEPEPQVWSEKDIRRARGSAAKWRAETVNAEPPVEAEPTDEALARCFAHTTRPIRAELYPLVREELAGWDARIAAEEKPEGERYASGDVVIVRPVVLDPESGKRKVLPEYVGAVSGWEAPYFMVRALVDDEYGFDIRPVPVDEMRPATAEERADVHARIRAKQAAKAREEVALLEAQKLATNRVIEERARAVLEAGEDRPAVEGAAGYVFRTSHNAVCVQGVDTHGAPWDVLMDGYVARFELAGWHVRPGGGFHGAHLVLLPPYEDAEEIVREGARRREAAEALAEVLAELSGPIDDGFKTALGEMYAVVAEGTAVPVRANRLVVGMDVVAAVRLEQRTVDCVTAPAGESWVRVGWTPRDHHDSSTADARVFGPEDHLVVTLESVSRLFAPVSPDDLVDLAVRLHAVGAAVPAYLRPEATEAVMAVEDAWEALRVAETPAARDRAHTEARAAAARARGVALTLEARMRATRPA
ncbi:hypothetical protein AB0D73_28890 [Streptomyces sp. NPDC048215]|uniref:hypothetical protein n=1 Tax=Streptomyces sp. NPDC048215 TaxID=3156690 RepID=UPI003404482D